MIIIGLTGGIACGKSTILKIFKKFNCATFDSDKYVNSLVLSNLKVKSEIIKHFPNILHNNNIDKKLLRTEVFNNYEKNILILEDILHPYVKNKIKRLIFLNKILLKKYLVLEVPLLFESGLDKICDYTITINVNREIQINRALHRGNISFDNLVKVLKKQGSQDLKIKKSNFVINNSQLTHNLLTDQIKEILDNIKKNKIKKNAK